MKLSNTQIFRQFFKALQLAHDLLYLSVNNNKFLGSLKCVNLTLSWSGVDLQAE